jgi:hypothetical protein
VRLRALEDALRIRAARHHQHDALLDAVHAHPRVEREAHVEWFEGNFEAYEEDKARRLGPDALEPKRVKYKKFTR